MLQSEADACRYLSRFATKTRAAFGLKIDSWQSNLLLTELECCQPSYGAAKATILDLPPQYLQLLFNEPALLNNPKISAAMDEVTSQAKEGGSTTATSLGLTPVLVQLLASSDAQRRTWARSQVEYVRRSLSFDEWTAGGVGTEVQGILFGDLDVRERWAAINLLLGNNRLAVDTVQHGLLEGKFDLSPARSDKSVMAPIARLLGSSSDSEWQTPGDRTDVQPSLSSLRLSRLFFGCLPPSTCGHSTARRSFLTLSSAISRRTWRSATWCWQRSPSPLPTPRRGR